MLSVVLYAPRRPHKHWQRQFPLLRCMRSASHTCISTFLYAVCTSQAIHASVSQFLITMLYALHKPYIHRGPLFFSSSAVLYAPRRPYMHRQVRSVLSCYMRFSSHVRMTKSIISLFAVYALRTIPASMGSTRTTLPSHGSRSHFVRPV